MKMEGVSLTHNEIYNELLCSREIILLDWERVSTRRGEMFALFAVGHG